MIKRKSLEEGLTITFLITLANLFSYLFQVSMIWLLEPADYGLLVSLLSISNILNFVVVALSLVIARFVAIFIATGKKELIEGLLNSGIKKALIFGLLAFMVSIVISPLISWFLHSPNLLYVPILFLSIFTIFLLPLFNGILQGMQRFVGFGIVTVALSFSKLLIAVVLIYFGLGIMGGIFGIALAWFGATGIAFLFLKDVKAHGSFDLFKLKQYAKMTILAVVFFGILANLDTILARHLLGAEEAGYYAMIAILGRIVLYAPMGIGVLLFPKVASAHSKGQNTTFKLLKALGATLFISGVIVAAYFIFPVEIISLLFGDKYAAVGKNIGMYGIAMLLLALIYILYNYYVSKDKNEIITILAGIVVIETLLVYLLKESIESIILAVFLSNLAGVLVFGIGKIRSKLKRAHSSYKQ